VKKYGFVFPVQPGKDALVREISAELRRRLPEYEASRRRAGVSLERAYLQRNPDGSMAVIAYAEGDRSFGEVLGMYLSSDAPLDRYFIDRNAEVTGIDFRNAPPSGPEPELVGEWAEADGGARKRGFAFAAPLQPGKTDAGRRFAQQAYVVRGAELAQSRREKGITRETVFVNQTPMGDIVVVYVEGGDPVEGNRLFAASQTPFDRWFKDQCREIFPAYVDFDQPVPVNEEVFSWVRA
jgi:hypothetical protein